MVRIGCEIKVGKNAFIFTLGYIEFADKLSPGSVSNSRNVRRVWLVERDKRVRMIEVRLARGGRVTRGNVASEQEKGESVVCFQWPQASCQLWCPRRDDFRVDISASSPLFDEATNYTACKIHVYVEAVTKSVHFESIATADSSILKTPRPFFPSRWVVQIFFSNNEAKQSPRIYFPSAESGLARDIWNPMTRQCKVLRRNSSRTFFLYRFSRSYQSPKTDTTFGKSCRMWIGYMYITILTSRGLRWFDGQSESHLVPGIPGRHSSQKVYGVI